MHRTRRQHYVLNSADDARGFSLLEVVIAVGIFATAVTVMLALLPALSRQCALAEDTLVAARLPDALRLELQRLIDTNGFNALAGETVPMATSLPATLQFVASRDGGGLHTLNYQPLPAGQRIADERHYFLVETWRFASGALAFDPSGATLALHVRVSWPYRLPGAPALTPSSKRESLSFNLAINP